MLENLHGWEDYLLFVSGLGMVGLAIMLFVRCSMAIGEQAPGNQADRMDRYLIWIAMAALFAGLGRWLALGTILIMQHVGMDMVLSILYSMVSFCLLGYCVYSSRFELVRSTRKWLWLLPAVIFVGVYIIDRKNCIEVTHVTLSLMWVLTGICLCDFGHIWRKQKATLNVRLLGMTVIVYGFSMLFSGCHEILCSCLSILSSDFSGIASVINLLCSFIAMALAWSYLDSFDCDAGKIRRPLYATVLCVLLGVILAGGGWAGHEAGLREYDRLSEALLFRATAASDMDVFQIQSLNANQRDLFSNNYALLKRKFIEMKRNSVDLSLIYLLRMNDGQITYLLDSELPGSVNYAAPGKLYHQPGNELIRSFTNRVSTIAIHRLEDGETGISALVPICEDNGTVVAVLGIDVPASEWHRTILHAHAEMTGYVWGLSLLVICGFAVVSRFRVMANSRQLSHSMYRSIVEGSPHCMALCGSDGCFMAINGTLAGAFTSQQDWVGRRFVDVWPATAHKTVNAALKTLFSGQMASFQAETQNVSGNTVWWQVTLNPLLSNDGKVVRFVAMASDITERRRVEKDRDQLSRQIEFVLSATGTRLNILDSDYNLKYVDPEWKKIYGSTKGRKCYEYLFGRDKPCDDCAMIEAMEHGTISVTQKCLVGEDDRPIEVTTIPFLCDDNKWLIAEVNVDISERLEQQHQQRSNETLTQALLQLSQMGDDSESDLHEFALASAVALTDSDIGYIALVNEKQDTLSIEYCSCSDHVEAELADYRRSYQLDDTGIWGDVLRRHRSVITNNYMDEGSAAIDFPIGCDHVVSHLGIPIFDGEHIVAIAGVMNTKGEYSRRDVNQLTLLMDAMWKLIVRGRAEESAMRARDFYLTLFDTFPALIWRSDRNGNCDYVNRTWQSFTGKTNQQHCEEGWTESLHPDDVTRCTQTFTEAFNDMRDFEMECRLKRHDGEYRWILNCGRPFNDLEGNFAGYLSTCYDMTERKRMEESLMRIRAAVDDSTDAIVITDEHGKVIYANTAFVYIFDDCWEDVDPRGLFVDPKVAERVFLEIRAGVSWKGEASMKARGGEIFSALVRGTAILDDDMRVIGEMLLIDDMTESKRMEGELRQSQKLTAVGELASGIAHEINTPMQYVGDNTRFLQSSFEDLLEVVGQYRRLVDAAESLDDVKPLVSEVKEHEEDADVDFLSEEIPQAISQSLEGIERVTTIVRAMRDMAHPGKSEKTATDLNRLIESTVTVSRNEWKYVADLEMDLDDKLPLVPCMPGEFGQVILNLVVNASQAIADVVGDGADGKGRIVVSTRHDGEYAEIRVADNGSGIPDSVLPRIFEPFFTTKEVGKGTGQGLTISRNVVMEKHGGTFDLKTRQGEGTTFIVRLPLKATQVQSGEFNDSTFVH